VGIRFYNTLSGKVEEFVPLEPGKVRMYACGPTVYDYAHIGNYRTFVFQDILRRHLRYRGYQLTHVMNVTDVDDKTIRNAQAAGMSLRYYTDRYIREFHVDRELLNIETPEVIARATDHVPDMVKLIQKLVEKGFAYRSEGSIYFRVSQFPGYGKLSKIDLEGMRAGARVDSDEYDKANVRDFVLWKAAKEGEPSWETPLGPGRPGWHIECSSMSMKYLGETFDIHSGGGDLAFPHHENEIAQSEAATGKPFVRYWLHSEHLIVNGQKMSKSLGNYFTLRNLIEKGYKPSAVRYLLASVPYRKPFNFTFDGLHQAQQSIERMRTFRFRLEKEKFPPGANAELAVRAKAAITAFGDALDDNLNTAEALAAIFDLVRESNIAMDRGEFHDGDRAPMLEALEHWDRIFAVLEDDDHAKLAKFGFIKPLEVDVSNSTAEGLKDSANAAVGNGSAPSALAEGLSDAEIARRIAERNAARARRDFAGSDKIRNELLEAGVILEDTKAGTRWKRK
jgi:cysteinyl-tRNA synthetase